MLAIGRALMSRPKLLLVDELSLGLAPLITKSIYRTLSALGSDITILLVEQNVEQALSFSQRAYILESGRMTRSGKTPPTSCRMPTSAGPISACSTLPLQRPRRTSHQPESSIHSNGR